MRILFQGDSITDAGRDYNNDGALGRGYALLVEAALGYAEPGEHTFINKGISGNRIVDVYARMKRDILNYKPDVMSILIGVNDVWHELSDSPNGVDADKFFKIYSMLIEEVKEALVPEIFNGEWTKPFAEIKYYDENLKFDKPYFGLCIN